MKKYRVLQAKVKELVEEIDMYKTKEHHVNKVNEKVNKDSLSYEAEI